MIQCRSVLWVTGCAVGLWLVSGAGAHDSVAVAWLGVLVVGPAIPRTLRALVAAIAVGAAVVGAIAGSVVIAVGGPVAPAVAAAIGAAVGGGVGSAVWLFVAPEDPEDVRDVTVDVGETAPAPRPADLFEANPDPILFVGGPEPAVLAANPAFGDVFGVDPDDVEGRPLADWLSVETQADAILDAATEGRSFEAMLTCETATGPWDARVRFVPTGGAHGTGYVVYGPADAAG